MAEVVLDATQSFNDSGLLFSYLGADGKLKIWDTSTGVLKQEYTKNLHLSSPCTCLQWLQHSKQSTPIGHKKKKLRPSFDEESSDVIALGTLLGHILIYDVATSKINSTLEGHTSKVNHLSWSKGSSSFFSCSDDNNIIEWDFNKYTIKSKWKPGKERVNCILALSNGKTFLTAGSSIKLWDLKTKQVLKKFPGHATEIRTLVEVPDRDGYFISASQGDRIISAWSLNSQDKSLAPVASFLLQDGALSLDVGNTANDTTLCAVSTSGILHVFKHKLNGNIGKALKPVTSISIASETNNTNQITHPIPIHAVRNLSNGLVIIAYGNPVILSFEKIQLKKQQENVVLIREEKRKTVTTASNSKAKVAEITEAVEYQVPGTAPLKRKNNAHAAADVSLENRLENLALANPSFNDTPKIDSMAHLLIQGLQSKDKRILQTVLLRNEESVINSTVKRLPIQALAPLLRELTALVQGKTLTNKCAVSWLMSVLRNHSGVLLSNPEVVSIFEPLLATIEARVSLLPSLLRLKGRLSLVSEQITSNTAEKGEINEPLLYYEEQDSSDDDNIALAPESSESEENWDEFTEMEDDQEDEMDDQ